MNGYEKRTRKKRETIIKVAQELFAEKGITAVSVLISGFIDPSFWLFGIVLVAIPMTVTGSIVTFVWYRLRKSAGVDGFVAFKWMIANLVVLGCLIVFILAMFSGGPGFMF